MRGRHTQVKQVFHFLLHCIVLYTCLSFACPVLFYSSTSNANDTGRFAPGKEKKEETERPNAKVVIMIIISFLLRSMMMTDESRQREVYYVRMDVIERENEKRKSDWK